MGFSKKKLLSLKAEFKKLTAVDWSPNAVIPAVGDTTTSPEVSGNSKRKKKPRNPRLSQSFVGGAVSSNITLPMATGILHKCSRIIL